jgi:hypothetical protein
VEQVAHGTELLDLSRDDVLDAAGDFCGIEVAARIEPEKERTMDRKAV